MTVDRPPISTPLRLTGILIAVFVAALLLTFSVSFLVIRADFDKTLRGQVQVQMDTYLALLGPEARRARLTEDLKGAQARFLLIDYRPALGPRLTNVEGVAPFVGFRALEEDQLTAPGIDDSYMALGVNVDGGSLVVAQTRSQMTDMGEVFGGVLLISLLPTLAIASGLGLVFARRARRRIEAISGVLQGLQAGDLSARVALDPADRDDLAAIGQAVNAMASAQQAAMAALKQTTTDIAHDLKTPIQRVALTLDRLGRQQALGADQRALVDQALAETDHVARTFDALLRIAQIEGGAMQDRFAPVDLCALADDMVEMFAASAEDSGHQLNLVADGPCQVMGDRDLLGQVLANLIENGLRHVPAGGQITVSLSGGKGAHGRGVILQVTDTGPGIPVAERQNVLRRLYRLERSRTTPGNGLGLSMVVAICDLHHATLTLGDAAPGLCVTIQFPPAPSV